jgi:hypothetical protein
MGGLDERGYKTNTTMGNSLGGTGKVMNNKSLNLTNNINEDFMNDLNFS